MIDDYNKGIWNLGDILSSAGMTNIENGLEAATDGVNDVYDTLMGYQDDTRVGFEEAADARNVLKTWLISLRDRLDEMEPPTPWGLGGLKVIAEVDGDYLQERIGRMHLIKSKVTGYSGSHTLSSDDYYMVIYELTWDGKIVSMSDKDTLIVNFNEHGQKMLYIDIWRKDGVGLTTEDIRAVIDTHYKFIPKGVVL